MNLAKFFCLLSLIILSSFNFASCGKKNTTTSSGSSSGTLVSYTPYYYFCNFSKDERYIYLGSYGDSTDPHLGIYSFNSSTGVTSLVQKMSMPGNFLTSLVYHPSLNVLYITMDYKSIFTYLVDTSTGLLTYQSSTTMNTSNDSAKIKALAIHPNGNFAYAVDDSDNFIETFNVDASGDLTYSTSTNGGTGPISLILDSTGDHLYVPNFGGHNISVFNVNSSTGALTLAQTISTGSASSPSSLGIDPSGEILVSSNYQSQSAYVFSINAANGQLTFDSSVDTGNGPSSVNFDDNTMTVYIGNYLFNSVSLYRYTRSPPHLTFLKNVGTVINYPNKISMSPSRSYLCSSSSGQLRYYQVLKIKDSSGDLLTITEN